MAKNIRFGEYVQAVTVDSDSISYSKLIPKPKLDKNGKEIPMKPEKMQLAGSDIYNLLQPYISVRFMEQLQADTKYGLCFCHVQCRRALRPGVVASGARTRLSSQRKPEDWHARVVLHTQQAQELDLPKVMLARRRILW